MAQLRRGPERGFTFVSRDREERYFGYEELEAEAHRRAAFFAHFGLQQGDRVALIIPEPHHFVLSFLGASVAGVVPVPVYPRASFKNVDAYVDILAHIVLTSGAKVALCMEGNREVVTQVKERVHAAGHELRVVKVEDAFDGTTPAGFVQPLVKPDDLCFLQFTSGSTNKPKGVMVRHRNLVANARAFLGPQGLNRNDDDKGVSWLPLFHDMGLIGFVLGTLVCDIPVVLLPTETFARSPGLWLQTITQHRGTITYAPNFAYQLVTQRVRDSQLEQLDLRSLRVAGSGAEPIRAKTLQAFAERFSPVGFSPNAFLPSYGMAEATLAITFHPQGTPLQVDRVELQAMKDGVARPASEGDAEALEVLGCGRCFPEHEVKVVDESGATLPERRVGQILTRGPSVTDGYFENPEATADAWDEEGWLKTGDLGYFADGHLFICGRVKDLIIIRGANHYPQDIEWSIAEIEGVRRGNVFAFSVMRDGVEELVIAAEGAPKDKAFLTTEITRKVQREFGLTPTHIAICALGSLPKTSSGKAQRRKAAALFEAGELAEHKDKSQSDGGEDG